MKKEVIAEMVRENLRSLDRARNGLSDAEFEYRNSTLVGNDAVMHVTFEAVDTALGGIALLLVSIISLIEASEEYEDGAVLNEWDFSKEYEDGAVLNE